MEFWEVTKQRAQQTLPVWSRHTLALRIGGQGIAELGALIAGFEPLVQQRALAQDAFDAAFRAGQDARRRMQVLGTKVPALIVAQLDENAALMQEVDALYATTPRTESSILKRLRELLPVWQRANAALAALNTAQPPITRRVDGVPYTAALAQMLLDGYPAAVGMLATQAEALNTSRASLRGHDHTADRLNKRWYKIAKAQSDPGSGLRGALEGITTEWKAKTLAGKKMPNDFIFPTTGSEPRPIDFFARPSFCLQTRQPQLTAKLRRIDEPEPCEANPWRRMNEGRMTRLGLRAPSLIRHSKPRQRHELISTPPPRFPGPNVTRSRRGCARIVDQAEFRRAGAWGAG